MHRSDRWRAAMENVDWRGWLALAWVAWFGVLYGTMVVEQRGGKFRQIVAGPQLRADHPTSSK